MMEVREIVTPYNVTFLYKGPSLEEGKLPAFIYFALTAEESLNTHPYNTPVALLEGEQMRLFSVTLPSHEKGSYESTAIKKWSEEIAQGNYILEEFIDNVALAIEWLIISDIVDEKHLALGGLSRGGFIATHLAGKVKQARYLLCFAPLTNLNDIEEFKAHEADLRFQSRMEKLNLNSVLEHLTHLHFLRFYIGNNDTRVGTDNCYHLIRKITEKGFEKKARHFNVELNITQSIGHKGHGTSPSTFQEGTFWLKQHLLKE